MRDLPAHLGGGTICPRDISVQHVSSPTPRIQWVTHLSKSACYLCLTTWPRGNIIGLARIQPHLPLIDINSIKVSYTLINSIWLQIKIWKFISLTAHAWRLPLISSQWESLYRKHGTGFTKSKVMFTISQSVYDSCIKDASKVKMRLLENPFRSLSRDT